MRYHLVYCTTNLVNGKQYVGIHSTNDKDDGYLGSGTLFKEKIEEYGVENFEREILFDCDSRKEAVWLEKIIVSQWLVDKWGNGKYFYNLCEGGGRILTNVKHKRKIKPGVKPKIKPANSSDTRLYLNDLKNKYNGKIVLLDNFYGLSETGEHECLTCGCVWTSFCSNVLLKGCPVCRKGKRKHKKLVNNMFAILENSYKNKLEKTTTLRLLEGYKGLYSNTFHVCLNCKARWYESPSNMLKGCAKCTDNGLEYHKVLYHYRIKC